MSIDDFVCYTLQVPINIDGYSYVCKAIAYVVEHEGDSMFYKAIQENCGKSYSCIEKSLRLAKQKALESMTPEVRSKIYPERVNPIKTKEFICYAAYYYKKEFMNEDKEG